MPDTWLGRYSRYLEKLFNVKGGPSLVDLNPSVSGVLQMSDPPLEERYLLGIESFGGADGQPGVAGNKSAIMIRNPISSGIIVTVEKIQVAPGTAASTILLVVAGSNPADLATAIPNHTRADPRSRSIGSAVLSRDAPAVDPTTGFLVIANFTVSTNLDLIVTRNQEIVLLPQIAMRIVCSNLNTSLTATIFWRERPLESSELN